MTIITWTGLEVAALRAALRDTQVQFADRIGCSVEAVGKWERRGADIALGAKYSECMDTACGRLNDEQRARFDAVLHQERQNEFAGVPKQLPEVSRVCSRSSAVTTWPSGGEVSDSSYHVSHDDGISALRRTLMGCIPDVPPARHFEIAAAVANVWHLFFSARLGELEQVLPTALAGAYNAVEETTGEKRRQVQVLLAQLLHAASNLLGYMAHTDLAALALFRAESLTGASGDELTRAAIRGSQSWLLTKCGLYDDAVVCAEDAAAEIEPRLSTATPRHISIWGELLCYAAFAASLTGDYCEPRRYLRLCESAGTLLDDEYCSRPEVSNVFGRSSAASFGMINEIGANRPREALELAAVITCGNTGIPPTLLSRRLVNVAQAQIGTRDDAGAVDTLHKACAMAPEFVRHIPLAHSLTDDLLSRRSNLITNGLGGVAAHLGSFT
ncbi:helix-turn-helix domain-containing protein [Nocardia kruczakiae]|uniref:helix-turn-helix domain-containing protein n=1 Tax=Nocardia kruczakiae TaxID=261477 RepID=UPI0007A3FA62|nr:transcriptional regulator [Nocardia kruczakiae]